MKYFKEESKMLLSEYLERVKLSESFDKERTIQAITYMIECLGDVELPSSIIEEFVGNGIFSEP